jgi:hypothetical protein
LRVGGGGGAVAADEDHVLLGIITRIPAHEAIPDMVCFGGEGENGRGVIDRM